MQNQTIIRCGSGGVAALLPALAQAANAAVTPVFGAPGAFSAAGAGWGGLRVLLALTLVLAAVFGAAALLRRLRMLGAGGTAELQILAQVALGARERAVLLRVGDQQLLIGVAPGSVRLLSVLTAPASGAGTPPALAVPVDTRGSGPRLASFREVLRRSLGR